MDGARAFILAIFFIIPVWLQGLQAAEVLEVNQGKSFRYSMSNVTMTSGDVCSVLAPNSDIPYQLLPLSAEQLADSRMAYYSTLLSSNATESQECGVYVRSLRAGDTGTWTLMLNGSLANSTEKFIVREVVPTTDVVPKEPVTIIVGQDLYLRFARVAVKNLIECSVSWTNGRAVILQPGATVDPFVEYWGSGFQEDCGVKAKEIGPDDGGTWTLKARNIKGEIVEGVFTVQVINSTTYVGEDQIIVSESYVTLHLSANESKYCILKRPSSERQEPSTKPCDIIINPVTKSSTGDWIATFAVPGQMNEIQTNTSVEVIDVETMHTSLTPSSRLKGGLDLLCRWTIYKYVSNTVSSCRFVRPDGVGFSLEDGIGNENYSYFGEGVNFSANIKDCGITIKSPAAHDEGTWQCMLGAPLYEIKGSFINVPASKKVRVLEAAPGSDPIAVSGGEKEIVVESGKAVTFGCRATASLNYCWFKHPNGTVFTPSRSKQSSTRSTVTYAGLGLALGDCTIMVTEATTADAGIWTCSLGIQGEADKQVAISVRVSEGNVVSTMPQVELKAGSSATLGCQSVPEGVALAYCRFVRPDGTAFGFTTNNDVVMSRYSYSGPGLEKGVCGMTINPTIREDFGQWGCFALHVQSYTEGQASITLIDGRALSAGAVAGIVIGCMVAVIAVGGVFSARYYRRKRR